MFSDKDDEPKTAPKEKDKDKSLGIDDIDMNQMIMIVALVGVLFLFKDEVMNIFNEVKGGLGGGGGGGPTGAEGVADQTLTDEDIQTAPNESTGDRGASRRVSAGERMKKHRDRRKGRRRNKRGGSSSKSYFGIANA